MCSSRSEPFQSVSSAQVPQAAQRLHERVLVALADRGEDRGLSLAGSRAAAPRSMPKSMNATRPSSQSR